MRLLAAPDTHRRCSAINPDASLDAFLPSGGEKPHANDPCGS